jgi:hypothetical protein
VAHEQRGPFNFGKLWSQSVNDLRGGEIPLVAWFEDDEATSGVGCLGTLRPMMSLWRRFIVG